MESSPSLEAIIRLKFWRWFFQISLIYFAVENFFFSAYTLVNKGSSLHKYSIIYICLQLHVLGDIDELYCPHGRKLNGIMEGGEGYMEFIRSVANDGLSQDARKTFSEENGLGSSDNSAVNAMRMLQNEMAGEAEKAGLFSEADINAMVKEIRDGGA